MSETLSRLDAWLKHEIPMLRKRINLRIGKRHVFGCLVLTIALLSTSAHAAFDQSHAKFTELLKARVVWISHKRDEEGMGLQFTQIDAHAKYAILACAHRGQE